MIWSVRLVAAQLTALLFLTLAPNIAPPEVVCCKRNSGCPFSCPYEAVLMVQKYNSNNQNTCLTNHFVTANVRYIGYIYRKKCQFVSLPFSSLSTTLKNRGPHEAEISNWGMLSLYHPIGEANNEKIVETLLSDGFEYFLRLCVINLFQLCIEFKCKMGLTSSNFISIIMSFFHLISNLFINHRDHTGKLKHFTVKPG